MLRKKLNYQGILQRTPLFLTDFQKLTVKCKQGNSKKQGCRLVQSTVVYFSKAFPKFLELILGGTFTCCFCKTLLPDAPSNKLDSISQLRGCLREILFRTKWNIFSLLCSQSLIIVYKKYLDMKLIAAFISLRSFWQKRNFISGNKCHVNTTPK